MGPTTLSGAESSLWASIAEGFTRRAHLEYMPLPGGSAAIRQPWRMAVAQLVGLYGLEETLKLPLPVIEETGERDIRLVAQLVARGLNTPQTSSAGRLFDAVSALAGLLGSRRTTYEGQAAVELELAAEGPADGGYPFRLGTDEDPWTVQTGDVLTGVVEDLLSGRSAGRSIGPVSPDNGGGGRGGLLRGAGGGRRRVGRALGGDVSERVVVDAGGGGFGDGGVCGLYASAGTGERWRARARAGSFGGEKVIGFRFQASAKTT